MYCKNHPSVETGVSCSNCGDPICPDCMVFTPVGAKCAGCARMPKTALVRIKPRRQALTVAAGLGSAAVGGYLFGVLLSVLSILAFFVAFGLGMAIGEAVSWASGRHHGSKIAAWAASCAAFGVIFPFALMGLSMHGAGAPALLFALAYGGVWKLIWIAAAAFGAWQRNA